MKISKSLLVSMIFLLIALGAAVWLYPTFPARMPVHWNLQGEVDRYGARFWVAAAPALIQFCLLVLMVLLPVVSPRKFEIKPFANAYSILMLTAQGVVLVVGLSVLLVGAGYALPILTVAMLSTGLMLMVAGNYTTKLRKNFFIGVRTPWTLANSAVWERTHRMAGRSFMLGGLVTVIATLAHAPLWVALAAALAPGLVACVYSYWIYRVLERQP